MGEVLAPLIYDLHDPAVIADPYPTYARMRQKDPVWHNPASETWVVTRYADVMKVLLASEASNHRVEVLLTRDQHWYGDGQGLHAFIGDPQLRLRWDFIDDSFTEDANGARQILNKLQEAYHNAGRDDLLEVVRKWRETVE